MALAPAKQALDVKTVSYYAEGTISANSSQVFTFAPSGSVDLDGYTLIGLTDWNIRRDGLSAISINTSSKQMRIMNNTAAAITISSSQKAFMTCVYAK